MKSGASPSSVEALRNGGEGIASALSSSDHSRLLLTTRPPRLKSVPSGAVDYGSFLCYWASAGITSGSVCGLFFFDYPHFINWTLFTFLTTGVFSMNSVGLVSQVVSIWTCSKLCAICFVAGVVVGYSLKRCVNRWVSKLLRRLKDH